MPDLITHQIKQQKGWVGFTPLLISNVKTTPPRPGKPPPKNNRNSTADRGLVYTPLPLLSLEEVATRES